MPLYLRSSGIDDNFMPGDTNDETEIDPIYPLFSLAAWRQFHIYNGFAGISKSIYACNDNEVYG